jgi:hypothetical protein
VVQAPSNGTLSFNADGSFTYTPNAGFVGTDSFTYLANDSKVNSDPATVNITVNPPTTMPTISFTASPSTLVEANEDNIVLTFQLSEPPPEGGLEVTFDSGVERSLSQFDVVNASFEGVRFLRANATSSAVTVRLLQQTATITIPLFKDDVPEEPKTFTYTLSPVPGYDFVPGEDAITFTILDVAPSTLPVISLTASPDIASEAEANFVTFNFTTTGDFPADGIIIGTTEFFDSQFDFNFNFEDPNLLSGIEFFDYVESDTGEVTVFWKLTQADAFIKLKAFDDNIAEQDYVFNLSLRSGSDYEINPEASSASVTIIDGVPNLDTPVVSFTVDKTNLIEGESLTITFTVDGDLPAEGLRVNVASGIRGSLGEFAIFDAEGNFLIQTQGITGVPEANENASGFSVVLNQNTASLTIGVFDDGIEEGVEEFTFRLLDGENYGVNPEASSITLSLSDAVVSTLPVISFTASPDVVSEAEGTVLTLTFNTTGDIPPEGITVRVQGDVANIMRQFTAAQVRFDAQGNVFYRFDRPLVETGVTGGRLDLFALEADLSSFTFTILEPTATIRLPVLNDILEESDATFTYTLEAGEGYTVDPVASSANFTVTDGVPGGVGPVVSVSATPSTLFESESTVLTVTFTLDTPPPEGGVVVYLDSGVPRSIAQFNVTVDNPRNPEESLNPVGLTTTGGTIVGTNEFVSAVLFRITEQTATITVPVFNNGEVDGPRTYTYTLRDGEQYQVNPEANQVTITIDDAITIEQPVVGFTASPVVSEADGPGLVLFFNVAGIIPEEGIVVSVGGELRASVLAESLLIRNRIQSEGIQYLRFNSATQAYEFRLTQADSTITIPIFDDIVEEADKTYTYELLAGETYRVDPAAATAEVTYTDGVPGGVGPVVSISTEQTALYEGDTLTVNFSVDGEIPEGGLKVFVLSPTRGALGEFVIFNPDRTPAVTWEGIAGFPEPDGTGGGFFVTLTEATASLTVKVFDDGPNEGVENITFNLVDGELYQVNPDASGITLTISDAPTSPIGDAGDNILVGTFGNDKLFGNAGNDQIFGGVGDDYLFGGAGNDLLDGGDGNDALFGGDGNDTLLGGAGNDYLYGGPGDNLLDGGDGNDILYAGNGNNTLLGGAGNDIIYSGSGQNLINGGLGDDLIFLNGGQDTVVVAQGAGVDTINNFQVSLGQKVGLSGGLTFEQLTLTQSGLDTLVKVGDETLAVLKFVQSSSLSSSTFTVV